MWCCSSSSNSSFRSASLQTSFVTLDEAMKVTNRRVNALENVTIPHIEGILNYISRELDELEREDFTRLKKVQASKEERLKEEAEEKAVKEEVSGSKSRRTSPVAVSRSDNTRRFAPRCSFAISNAVDTTSDATRFVHRSC